MYECMMRKLCLFTLSAAAALSLCSCADTDSTKTSDNTSTTAAGASSIPWDQPDRGENTSQVPGAEFMNSQ